MGGPVEQHHDVPGLGTASGDIEVLDVLESSLRQEVLHHDGMQPETDGSLPPHQRLHGLPPVSHNLG